MSILLSWIDYKLGGADNVNTVNEWLNSSTGAKTYLMQINKTFSQIILCNIFVVSFNICYNISSTNYSKTFNGQNGRQKVINQTQGVESFNKLIAVLYDNVFCIQIHAT